MSPDCGPPRPVYDSIQIELTSCCNYRCANCPQAAGDPRGGAYYREKGYVDIGRLRRTFEAASQVTDLVNFSFFGEPTLHADFDLVMAMVARRREGLRVVLNTNLSRMTTAMFDRLVAARLDELRISVDAASEATYERTRPGAGVVDRAGRPAANRFAAVCAKMEDWFLRPDHVPTRHVYAVSSLNRDDLPSYVDRWSPLLGSADSILAKSILTYGGIMNDPLVSAGPCHIWERPSLTIDWRGALSPCNLDVNMALAVGWFDEDDLATLPDTPRWREVAARSAGRTTPPCDRCMDANNWAKNIVFKQGDRISPEMVKSRFGSGGV